MKLADSWEHVATQAEIDRYLLLAKTLDALHRVRKPHPTLDFRSAVETIVYTHGLTFTRRDLQDLRRGGMSTREVLQLQRLARRNGKC